MELTKQDNIMNQVALVQERYSQEIIAGIQESKDLYKQYLDVDSETVVGDSKTYYVGMPGGELQEKEAFSDCPDIGGGVTPVILTLKEVSGSTIVAYQDMAKLHLDQRYVATDVLMKATTQAVNKAIRTELANTTNANNVAESGTDGLTEEKIDILWENFTNNYFFQNGDTPIVKVGAKQWSDLMKIEDFKSADKIGFGDLPSLFSKSETGRIFRNMIFQTDANLPKTGNKRTCFAFVRPAVKLAYGEVIDPVGSEIKRNAGTVTFFSKIKMGAKIMHNEGVVKIECYEA